jgi:hypothetical protein
VYNTQIKLTTRGDIMSKMGKIAQLFEKLPSPPQPPQAFDHSIDFRVAMGVLKFGLFAIKIAPKCTVKRTIETKLKSAEESLRKNLEAFNKALI